MIFGKRFIAAVTVVCFMFMLIGCGKESCVETPKEREERLLRKEQGEKTGTTIYNDLGISKKYYTAESSITAKETKIGKSKETIVVPRTEEGSDNILVDVLEEFSDIEEGGNYIVHGVLTEKHTGKQVSETYKYIEGKKEVTKIDLTYVVDNESVGSMPLESNLELYVSKNTVKMIIINTMIKFLILSLITLAVAMYIIRLYIRKKLSHYM